MREPVERRIAELLNDPLTGLLIAADGVDRSALAAQLRRVATAPAEETHVAPFALRPRSRGRFDALVGKMPAVLCGACAP